MPHGEVIGPIELLLPDDLLKVLVGVVIEKRWRAELPAIVCGNAVPRIFGRNGTHVLSPPQPGRPSGPAIATAVVELTGGWVAATLHRDG